MASGHAFASRYFFFPLYLSLQEIVSFLPFPLPPVDLVFSHEIPTSMRTTNGLPSSMPQIVVGYLGGSYRPEAICPFVMTQHGMS